MRARPLVLGLAVLFGVCVPAAATIPNIPLEPVPLDQRRLDFEDGLWEQKQKLLLGIDYSLSYLVSSRAETAYLRFEKSGISRTRVVESLRRFKDLLRGAQSAGELKEALAREFELYRAVQSAGKVRLTGYFQPVYQASKVPTNEYRYPLYRAPVDFSRWRAPHPTRVALEGFDGLGNPAGPLIGRELAWLRSRYEIYMIQVQGSAILRYTDGRERGIGFAAGTAHPFCGVASSMMRDGLSLPRDPERYFALHPELLNRYLAKNNRVVFFQENSHPVPIGSLGVPVVAERSIATDKALLPPGALALIGTRRGESTLARFVLDHDAGSAIKGPSRVDLFMGTGPEAQRKAYAVTGPAQLYYLLLK